MVFLMINGDYRMLHVIMKTYAHDVTFELAKKSSRQKLSEFQI